MKKRPRSNKIMEKVLHDRPTYTDRTVLSRKLIVQSMTTVFRILSLVAYAYASWTLSTTWQD